MGIQFTLPTFLMAMAGLLLHFLFSWGEFWRAKDTLRIGAYAYVLLDPPAWISSALGAVVFYIALPEIGSLIGAPVAVAVTPTWALAAGYMGSSMAPKILGLLVARAGVR